MQNTLETLGQLERRLHVSVPLTQIDAEINKRLQRLARTARIAGFRPGKVPLKMVAQQYGSQVRSEVIGDTVQETFSDALRTQNLRIAGYPRIEPKPMAEGSSDFEYSATFEVYPEVAINDLSATRVTRPIAEVTDADVDSTLGILRRQRATYQPVERGAETGDRVLTDFLGKIDGVEFPGGQGKDFPILLGEGRMLPEFEAALPGMRAGESKSFNLLFPADYHGAEVAGKTAQFDLTVKEVSVPVLPEIDSEFAKTLGIADGDLEKLRAEITANLKLELKRKIEARLRDQVMQALKAAGELSVPNALIDQEAARMHEQAITDLKGRGVSAEQARLEPSMFRSAAEERVRLGLVLSEVVNRQKLQPKPEQIRTLVEEAAQSYEQPSAVVGWHYQEAGRLAEFEAQALEHNVIDWVLTQAQVSDEPTTFAALMAPQSQAT
jgi:trigger factor